MAPDPATTLELPATVLAAILSAAAVGWALLAWMVRRTGRNDNTPTGSNGMVPQLDAPAGRRSPFHAWDVRFKLVSLIAFTFLVAATRSLAAALIAAAISLLALLISRVPPQRAMRRLLAMGGFLTMFLVIMPLSVPQQPQDTLIVFSGLDFLQFNVRGALLALSICGKACAIALLMEPLFATAPLSVTLEGFTRLGISPKVSQMVHLTYRYIFVFLEETQRMATAMTVRGFRKRTNLETLRVTGSFLGMLFVRSFERTHRVFAAMQARGYEGRFPDLHVFQSRPGDWAKAGFWLLLGVTLIILDRLWLSGFAT